MESEYSWSCEGSWGVRSRTVPFQIHQDSLTRRQHTSSIPAETINLGSLVSLPWSVSYNWSFSPGSRVLCTMCRLLLPIIV
jgi:hypothetical protein